MSCMVYNPKTKTVTTRDSELDLYCGDEFTDMAVILCKQAFGVYTLQETYTSMCALFNSSQIKGIEKQITDALNKAWEGGKIKEIED